jgi:hypothetical protein
MGRSDREADTTGAQATDGDACATDAIEPRFSWPPEAVPAFSRALRQGPSQTGISPKRR